MELNEFQNRAMSTCMDSCDNYSYMMLNLVGEVGELASKVAKDIRRGEASIEQSHLSYERPIDWEINRPRQAQEIGDILWMLAGLAQAGTIDGNGDGIYNR